MTGSLQIKGNKYYVVAKMEDEYGKKKAKWISTGISVEGNNKRLANQRMKEILIELDAQKSVYSKEISFVEWLSKWMELKKLTLRRSTYEAYEINVDLHIRPYFKRSALTLRSVSPQHIQSYVNKKHREGLSGSTIRKHMAIIRKDACRKHIIAINPADNVSLPALKKFKSEFYTAEEANRLSQVRSNIS